MSNSSRPPLSWKRFFLAVCVFLPLLFLCDRGLFRLFRVVEPISFTYSSLEDKLNAVPDKSSYEVLVLGTSRAFNAVLPKSINPIIGSKVFKEAAVGKGPKYHRHFYRMYRRIMGIPKVVVYGIDYFLFNIDSQPPLLKRFPECRELAGPAANGISLLLANKNRIDQYINSLQIQFQEKSGMAPRRFDPEKNVADMEAYAGRPVYDPSHVITEIPADLEKRRAPFIPFPGKEGRDYEELLRELKDENVTIFLVTLPDHIGTFQTYGNYRRFIKEHQNALRRLDYKNRCFLIDYDSPDKFPMEDRDCFINGGYGVTNSHLSNKGAEIFCRIFAKDLKQLLDHAKLPK